MHGNGIPLAHSERAPMEGERAPTDSESARVIAALGLCPGRRVRTEGLVGLLAPRSEEERRRMAAAVAAVARVVEEGDGRGGTVTYFVLRARGEGLPGEAGAARGRAGAGEAEAERALAATVRGKALAGAGAGADAGEMEEFPWMEGYDDDTGGGNGETGGAGGQPAAGVGAARVGLGCYNAAPPRVSEESVERLLSQHRGRMHSDALIFHFEPLSSLDRRKLSETVKLLARVQLPTHAGAPGIVVLRSTLAKEAAEARAAGVIQGQHRVRALRLRLRCAAAAMRMQAAARGRLDRVRRAAADAAARAAERARARSEDGAAVAVQRRARGAAARVVVAALRRDLIIASETGEERAGREAWEREERLRAKLRQRRREQQAAGAQGCGEGAGAAAAGGGATPRIPSHPVSIAAGEATAAGGAEGAGWAQATSAITTWPVHRQQPRGVQEEADAARLELRMLVGSNGTRAEA
jgi:hypothetical protein